MKISHFPGFSGFDKWNFGFRVAFTFKESAVRMTLKTTVRIFCGDTCVQHVLVGHYCQLDLSKYAKDCAESGTEQYL